MVIVYRFCIEYFLKEWNSMKEAPIILYIVMLFGIGVGVGIGYIAAKWRYGKLIEILKEKQSNLDIQTQETTKLDLSDYELDQDNGWFSHKKRGGRLCPKCLSSETGGMEIPLSVDNAGWDCPVCEESRITMKGPERFGTVYNP